MFTKPRNFANASEAFVDFLGDHFDGSPPNARALILLGGPNWSQQIEPKEKIRPLNSQWTSDEVKKWITESFDNSGYILQKLGAVPSAKDLLSPVDGSPAARFIAILKDLNVEGTIRSVVWVLPYTLQLMFSLTRPGFPTPRRFLSLMTFHCVSTFRECCRVVWSTRANSLSNVSLRTLTSATSLPR